MTNEDVYVTLLGHISAFPVKDKWLNPNHYLLVFYAGNQRGSIRLAAFCWWCPGSGLTQLSSTSLVTVKRASSVLDLRVSVSLAFKSILRLSAKVSGL